MPYKFDTSTDNSGEPLAATENQKRRQCGPLLVQPASLTLIVQHDQPDFDALPRPDLYVRTNVRLAKDVARDVRREMRFGRVWTVTGARRRVEALEQQRFVRHLMCYVKPFLSGCCAVRNFRHSASCNGIKARADDERLTIV